MGKKGPPPLSAAVIEMRGTTRKDRPRNDLGTDPEGYEPRPPTWLDRAAKKIWREKTAEYQRRGQRIQGFESMLAQYCALEADIIASRKAHREVTASTMSQLHRFAVAFYDTPSAAVDAGTGDTANPTSPKGDAGNPFDGRGKR